MHSLLLIPHADGPTCVVSMRCALQVHSHLLGTPQALRQAQHWISPRPTPGLLALLHLPSLRRMLLLLGAPQALRGHSIAAAICSLQLFHYSRDIKSAAAHLQTAYVRARARAPVLALLPALSPALLAAQFPGSGGLPGNCAQFPGSGVAGAGSASVSISA